MDASLPPARLNQSLQLTDPLPDLVRVLMRAAQKPPPPRHGPRRGATLRPGPQTPLWNVLVRMTRPHLRRHGMKSQLARILGVPPQRVHTYFVARQQAPDAERTLLLLTWLARQRLPLPREASPSRGVVSLNK